MTREELEKWAVQVCRDLDLPPRTAAVLIYARMRGRDDAAGLFKVSHAKLESWKVKRQIERLYLP